VAPRKGGQCFQAAGFELGPGDQGAGVDFQFSEGTTAGMGPEDFLEELDLPEERPLAEILRLHAVDEE